MTCHIMMKGIRKEFPGVLANDSIDFEVEEGEIHALLGENGAGKSTLMNVLYGLYKPDGGDIFIDGEKVDIHSPGDAITRGIGMVHQEFMLVPTFTVAESVALGLDRERSPLLQMEPIKKRIRSIAEEHGLLLDPDAYIDNLPIGVQQRVEIVKLLCRDAKVLILDEPTSVLTPQETDGLAAVLRSLIKEGCSVVFITHKMHEVMSICDSVTVLRGGKVIGTKKVSDTNPSELATMMVGKEVPLRTTRVEANEGEPILKLKDIFAEDDRNVSVLNGVSLEICQGQIVGLAGVDGNGQSQLAEVIIGLRSIIKGSVELGGENINALLPSKRYDRGMAYVPADRRGVGTITSLDIAKNSILGRVDSFATFGGVYLLDEKIKEYANEIINKFDVRTPGLDFMAGKLSGGNLQKLLLGRELLRNPQVLIVEQPTRGLDIGATNYVRSKIMEARDQGAAILLISSELDEIMDLSDRIAVIYEGKIMGIVPGEGADRKEIGLMMAGTRSSLEDTDGS